MYVAVDVTQAKLREIGMAFGGLTRNGVSNNYRRLARLLLADRRLRFDLNKIKGLLDLEGEGG